MYKRQRGCLPVILSSIGQIIFIGFSTVCLFYLVVIISQYYSKLFTLDFIKEFLSSGLRLAIWGSFIFYFSFLLSAMFPSIRISKNGIRYRYLIFWGGFIKWDEIEEIIDLKWPKNWKGIVISRKGFSLFNSTWLFNVYGWAFMRELEPIMLLVAGLEDREQIINEINAHLK
jgi:hypothetical protein